MLLKKVKIAGLDLACIDGQQTAAILNHYLGRKSKKDSECVVCLVSFDTLLLALLLPRMRRKLQSIDIICPSSTMLRWACLQLLDRQGDSKIKLLNPFQFIVSTLTALNSRAGSVFFLGDTRKNLRRAEKTVLRSFPQLRILGCYHGKGVSYHQKQVLQTVKKCAPDILLAGRGRFYRLCLSVHVNQGLSICHRPIMEIFARYRKTNRRKFNPLQHNFSLLSFFLPWAWIKLPFALIFAVYIFILKSRKVHDKFI